MRIRAAEAGDAAAIAEIYNQAVVHTTASFDIEPRAVEDRERWLAARGPRHPVIVAPDDAGAVIGWASLSAYSDRAAYEATVELGCYVDERARGRGVGRALTERLLADAPGLGVHVVLARICSENEVSLALVRSLGFRDAGVLHEVGRKFDRWLDVVELEFRVPTAE